MRHFTEAVSDIGTDAPAQSGFRDPRIAENALSLGRPFELLTKLPITGSPPPCTRRRSGSFVRGSEPRLEPLGDLVVL
jgi:hypothetical protein